VRGVIEFQARSLTDAGAKHVKTLRGRAISMIFQDPMAALNPVFRIREQFRAVVQRGGEGLRKHEIEKRMLAALRDVAIADPERILDSYTFQLSGGLNQRVMIAMGLVNNPKLLIADEPGTALDVTVQEQTLRIMRRLSESHGTAILFISHNLGVVRQFAHRVYVMYAGKIVEEAPTAEIFTHPGHPYTKALLASVPRLATPELPAPIDGSVPDLRLAREGCPFEPRCPVAIAVCTRAVDFTEVGSGHRVACVHAAEVVA
jgi:peptide/nickel transport system ATP-binding protein